MIYHDLWPLLLLSLTLTSSWASEDTSSSSRASKGLFDGLFKAVVQNHYRQRAASPRIEAVIVTKNESSYANATMLESKGVFDDIANGISSLFGGAGPAVDSGPAPGAVNLVPNNCWYRGEKYECALSLTCAIQGRKSLDLCNGGLIWTCCVDRDKIDRIDPELGKLSDAKCGVIYSGEEGRGIKYDDRQSRIVGGSDTQFGQHPWQVNAGAVP